MNNAPYMPLFVYSLPIVSAMIALLFLLVSGYGADRTERKLRNTLAVYFCIIAANWLLTVFFVYRPQWLVPFNGLWYGMLLAVQIVLYQFVYTLTRDRGDRKFSLWHYAIPVAFFVVITVWSFFVPHDAQIMAVSNRGQIPEGYEAYTAFIRTKALVRTPYSLLYFILALYRLVIYRRKVDDYSADAGKNSMSLLYLYIFLALPLLATPLIAGFFTPHRALLSLLGAIPAIVLAVQIPLLCHLTISRKYVLLEDNEYKEGESEEDTPLTAPMPGEGERKITREELERYMAEHKPFRRSDLKITELAAAFNTNRTNLSGFINRTYGMNYSRFINEYRLRELTALLADPSYAKQGNLALIMRAGFGSYDSYRRARIQHDREGMLEI